MSSRFMMETQFTQEREEEEIFVCRYLPWLNPESLTSCWLFDWDLGKIIFSWIIVIILTLQFQRDWLSIQGQAILRLSWLIIHCAAEFHARALTSSSFLCFILKKKNKLIPAVKSNCQQPILRMSEIRLATITNQGTPFPSLLLAVFNVSNISRFRLWAIGH